jgi:hypothetical protein
MAVWQQAEGGGTVEGDCASSQPECLTAVAAVSLMLIAAKIVVQQSV